MEEGGRCEGQTLQQLKKVQHLEEEEEEEEEEISEICDVVANAKDGTYDAMHNV